MAKGNEIVPASENMITTAEIQSMIHVVRGERVILDRDLAMLYGVETKNLKRQVKRNINRFPSDFMIELTREEYDSLWCQNGTLEHGRGEHSKYLPFAFTENGVAMLSSVLTSEVAVNINIQIMRAFTTIRKALSAAQQTTIRQDKLELDVEKLKNYIEDVLRDQNDINEEVSAQMDAISQSLVELGQQVNHLTTPDTSRPNPIGYDAIAEKYDNKNNN